MQMIRSHKNICGILLAVLLLSVIFYDIVAAREDVAALAAAAARYEEQAGAPGADAADAVICLPDAQYTGIPGGADCIFMVRLPAGQLLAGKQNGSRMWGLRFLAVVTALIFAASLYWHLAILNYGCRKVVLWRSICYIHRSDGEKGMFPVYGY